MPVCIQQTAGIVHIMQMHILALCDFIHYFSLTEALLMIATAQYIQGEARKQQRSVSVASDV